MVYLYLSLIYATIWMVGSVFYFNYKGYPYDKPWTYIAFGPAFIVGVVFVLVTPLLLFGII